MLVAAALCMLADVSPLHALDPEQATHVGGDLTTMGKRLATLQESGAKVIAAAPGAWAELTTALQRIAEARDARDFGAQLSLMARDTDIEKARKTVKQIGQDMMKDPELGKELLLPLKMQGVAEITDNAIAVPTAPDIVLLPTPVPARAEP